MDNENYVKNAFIGFLEEEQKKQIIEQQMITKANEVVEDRVSKLTRSDVGLSNVENKSSEAIRSEITAENIIGSGLTASDIGAITLDQASSNSQTLINNRLSAQEKSNLSAGKTIDGINTFYSTNNKPSKNDVGLGNVENKSSATIRSEITANDIPQLPTSKIINLDSTLNNINTRLSTVEDEEQSQL